MKQAVAIQDTFEEHEQAGEVAAGEVIDAFDHVIEALDEVYKALAQFAEPAAAERRRA